MPAELMADRKDEEFKGKFGISRKEIIDAECQRKGPVHECSGTERCTCPPGKRLLPYCD